MEALATYLMKSSVWLMGFALVYALFLRNERFFTLNRIYLVSGILGSIIFPLFTWHYTVLLPVVPSIEVYEPQVQGIVMPEEPLFTTQNALLILYLLGIIYLLFRIIRQTIPVFTLIRKSETQPYSSAKLIRTTEYPASFSFFSFVFVNPSVDEIETNEIVNHELEHIRQQHWIDLLLFEILRTMQWYNPVSWLYGHLIRQNHEYLADEHALQRSSNPAIYRAALLNQMFGGPVISLANSFNYSLNKKRFNMMKHTIKSPFRKLKLLLVLPLIAGVFYVFAAPEYKFIQTENSNVLQENRTVTGKVISEDGKPLKGASVIVSGKTIGTVSDASGNFKLVLTDDSPLVISYVGFESQKVNPNFGKEMVITMKTKIVEGTEATASANASKPVEIPENVLIIIDGKESTSKGVYAISPELIESTNVLKGETATNKYGERGKNGVIEITTKKGAANAEIEKSSATKTFKVQANSPLKFGDSDGSGNKPLIVRDGVIAENQNADNIPPETIESINVLKGESAIKKYGDKGKNGVIEIRLKKGESAAQNTPIEVKLTGSANNQNANQSNGGIQIRSTGTSVNEPKPLIVINGNIAENQNIDKIDPESIDHVNVLKGEQATGKYGEKAKNGVIEITLKPKTPFTMVEEMPSFPGGVEALNAFVNANLKYPPFCLEYRIQGRVIVSFVVDKNGSVTNAKLSRGVDPALDKEALRIVKSMPIWNPGKQNGECVEVAYEMPINFKIPVEKLRTTRATAYSYTKTTTNQTLKLGIVPNPTSDDARITLDGSESTNKLEISVYDSFGKLIKNASKNGATFSLSINKLPTGIYSVVGKDGENKLTVTGQLVVNH